MSRPPTISTPELRIHLENIILRVSMHHYPASQAMRLMLATGCRYNETQYFADWRYDQDTDLVTYTATKNDTQRSLPLTDLPDEFQQAIQIHTTPIHPVSYSTTRKLFAQHSGTHSLQFATKALELHAFRHLKARELWDTGHPIEQVMAYLGINSQAVAQGYLFKPIYLQ